eukprot:PhM_4_TR8291/c1_g1_i1/m.40588/K07198/PRKAA, AMPK; 5'-AMP-activated protein kinase, catalytic alpha subunit
MDNELTMTASFISSYQRRLANLELVTKIGDYIIDRILGQGGFGQVHLVHNSISGKPYALKTMQKSFIKQYDLDAYVKREIAVLKSMRHRHIVRYRDSFETDRDVVLVMELASHGELFDRIVLVKRFSEAVSRRYFQQLMAAVKYCHDQGICHRDLKAENLLLDDEDNLKLCDFGLSEEMSPEVLLKSIAGSVEYQAPELVDPRVKGYDGACQDIWSCGVILAFMLSGFLPFAGHSDEETMDLILKGRYVLHESVTDGPRDLLSKIFVKDPAERYKIEDIVMHPWFQVNLDVDLSEELSSPAPRRASFRGPFSSNDMKSGEEYVREVEEAFDAVDLEGKGYLSRAEMELVLKKLSSGISDEEVGDLITFFDEDGDNTISREEFIQGFTARTFANYPLAYRFQLSRMVESYRAELESELLNELRPIFLSLDTDKSGFVSAAQLQQHAEFKDVTAADIDEMFCIVPEYHRPGEFSFEEFVLAMMQGPTTLTKKFGRRLLRLRSLLALMTVRAPTVMEPQGGFLVAGLRPALQKRVRMHRDFVVEQEDSTTTFVHLKDDPTCKFSLTMISGVPGFVRIMPMRVDGSTTTYHRAVTKVLELFDKDRKRAEVDTEAVGEPELI